jgi:hypothetical protein
MFNQYKIDYLYTYMFMRYYDNYIDIKSMFYIPVKSIIKKLNEIITYV